MSRIVAEQPNEPTYFPFNCMILLANGIRCSLLSAHITSSNKWISWVYDTPSRCAHIDAKTSTDNLLTEQHAINKRKFHILLLCFVYLLLVRRSSLCGRCLKHCCFSIVLITMRWACALRIVCVHSMRFRKAFEMHHTNERQQQVTIREKKRQFCTHSWSLS